MAHRVGHAARQTDQCPALDFKDAGRALERWAYKPKPAGQGRALSILIAQNARRVNGVTANVLCR
jgi:hypothetical protein